MRDVSIDNMNIPKWNQLYILDGRLKGFIRSC